MTQDNYTNTQPQRKPLPPELQAVFDRLVEIGRMMREDTTELDHRPAPAFSPQGDDQRVGGES